MNNSSSGLLSLTGKISEGGNTEQIKLYCAGQIGTNRGPVRFRDRSKGLEMKFNSFLTSNSLGKTGAESNLC